MTWMTTFLSERELHCACEEGPLLQSFGPFLLMGRWPMGLPALNLVKPMPLRNLPDMRFAADRSLLHLDSCGYNWLLELPSIDG